MSPVQRRNIGISLSRLRNLRGDRALRPHDQRGSEIGRALGLDRIGLPGARLSIADAERTLAVTTPAATGRYSELWLLAALKRDGETVPAILQRGIRVVQERPHLAAAVRALLDCGFSHQRAGRRLCVHPNTVAYRVERWRELTGWEIGRGEGLRLTMAALAWAEGDAANADSGGL